MDASRAVVLMYHRIGESHGKWDDRYCVTPHRFASHMRSLQRQGFQAVPIGDYMKWLAGEKLLPEGSFLLTFDDGFLGVYEHARTVLLDLGWTATIFLVSDLIGLTDTWPSRDLASSRRRHDLMGPAHIVQMRREGFDFQSHSKSHLDLSQIEEAELWTELQDSKSAIERLTGAAIEHLAYPYGQFNDMVKRSAQAAGYLSAFSTKPGFNRPGGNRYEIRRLEVEGRDSAAALLRKVRLGSNDGSLLAAGRYKLSRIAGRLIGGLSV